MSRQRISAASLIGLGFLVVIAVIGFVALRTPTTSKPIQCDSDSVLVDDICASKPYATFVACVRGTGLQEVAREAVREVKAGHGSEFQVADRLVHKYAPDVLSIREKTLTACLSSLKNNSDSTSLTASPPPIKPAKKSARQISSRGSEVIAPPNFPTRSWRYRLVSGHTYIVNCIAQPTKTVEVIISAQSDNPESDIAEMIGRNSFSCDATN